MEYINEVKITDSTIKENFQSSIVGKDSPEKDKINQNLYDSIKYNSKWFSQFGSKCKDISVISSLVLGNSTEKIKQSIVGEILNNFTKVSSPIGYEIKNTGDNTIENIQTAEYECVKSDGHFIGSHKTICLRPGETIFLQTKWLILLLHRMEYGLQTNKGSFFNILEENNGSIDENFNNYKYSLEYEIPNTVIGVYNPEIDKCILANEYKSIFGYLCNKRVFNNTKILSNCAKFLSKFLIYRK